MIEENKFMLKKIIAILSCSATLLLNGAYQAPGPEISAKVKNLPQSATRSMFSKSLIRSLKNTARLTALKL